MTNLNNIIPTGRYIARIDEEICVGCTLCIKACPFDAIIGASKQMHTVISKYCTGCKLCLPPCPVDCIELEKNAYFESICKTSSAEEIHSLKKEFAEFSRNNKKQREIRLKKISQEKQKSFEEKKRELLNH